MSVWLPIQKSGSGETAESVGSIYFRYDVKSTRKILDHSLVHLLVCLRCSLICLLCTSCFAPRMRQRWIVVLQPAKYHFISSYPTFRIPALHMCSAECCAYLLACSLIHYKLPEKRFVFKMIDFLRTIWIYSAVIDVFAQELFPLLSHCLLCLHISLHHFLIASLACTFLALLSYCLLCLLAPYSVVSLLALLAHSLLCSLIARCACLLLTLLSHCWLCLHIACFAPSLLALLACSSLLFLFACYICSRPASVTHFLLCHSLCC